MNSISNKNVQNNVKFNIFQKIKCFAYEMLIINYELCWKRTDGISYQFEGKNIYLV